MKNPRYDGFIAYVFGINHEGKQDQLISPPFDTRTKANYWLSTTRIIAKRTGFKILETRVDPYYGKTPENNPKHFKCGICGKGTVHLYRGKPIHKKCLSRLTQVRAVKPNPARGTLIYGRVLKIFALKTSGPFKGQKFVHTFKPGAIMIGNPDGSILITKR